MKTDIGIPKVFLGAHEWPGLVRVLEGVSTRLVTATHGYKQAASRLFSKADIEAHAPPPHHFLVHQVVMGDFEKFGFNNNGDAYPADCLERYHPTFVTHGHVFREHHNQDPKYAIGRIKAARYSREEGRVELLKHVDIRLAEKEYEMAKAGKELLASQASRVPFDTCSLCNNISKFAATYCDDLKYRMRRWDEGRKKYAYAINPIATFFDSSFVANPAAREARHIEYRFGADHLAKAASTSDLVISGADRALADGLKQGVTGVMLDAREDRLLRKLAAVEGDQVPHFQTLRDAITKYAFGVHDLKDEHVQGMQQLMPANMWRKLASQASMLPFDVFCSVLTGRSLQDIREDAGYIKEAGALPGLFRTLLKQVEEGTGLVGQEDRDMFSHSDADLPALDPGDSDYVDRVFDQVHAACSVAPVPLRTRSTTIIIKQSSDRSASAFGAPIVSDVGHMGTLYGWYKLAALQHMPEVHNEDVMCALAVVQNSALPV